MKNKIIYGPPGTGKTTYLMKLLEKELETFHSTQIAFVSFTKKGTYEGASRAKKKFKFKDKDLLYFKTLHAICFRELSMSRMDMITKKHYKLLSKTTGINFTGYYTEDFSSSNDEYLHVAAMEKHNPKFANILCKSLNSKRYEYIKFQYQAMKDQLGISDFDDLLTGYLEKGQPLNIKVAFIDEAQDLTPLQWKVALKMFQNVERLYVAGDDDQAVYEWSGADVTKFLNFSADSIVLNKSYRLPKKILEMSKIVSGDIYNRKKKLFTDNGTKGKINSYASIKKIPLKGGELILARTNWILRQLSFDAIDLGILFNFKGKSSIDKQILKAIQAYIKFQDNKICSQEMQRFAFYFESLNPNKTWQQTVKLPSYSVRYYEKLIGSKALDKKPINFETFHSSKGSENEHVIISPELTKKVRENFNYNMDAELRCLYVGITRSKKELSILSPGGKDYYPNKYFI